MGYLTTVTGQIDITPPIPWSEFKDSPFANEDEWRPVRLHVETETVDTDEGVIERRTATAVVPATDSGYKAYDIEENLEGIVRQFGAGRSFTGRLEGEGEENGDVWRLLVRDGRVVKVVPHIVWPDE